MNQRDSISTEKIRSYKTVVGDGGRRTRALIGLRVYKTEEIRVIVKSPVLHSGFLLLNWNYGTIVVALRFVINFINLLLS